MIWLLGALAVWVVAALIVGECRRRAEARQVRDYAEIRRLIDATFPEFMRTGRQPP